ncbi:MAG: hypothetical protein AAFQ74_16880 [Cyanobacteria bacterium J06623_4]
MKLDKARVLALLSIQMACTEHLLSGKSAIEICQQSQYIHPKDRDFAV